MHTNNQPSYVQFTTALMTFKIPFYVWLQATDSNFAIPYAMT